MPHMWHFHLYWNWAATVLLSIWHRSCHIPLYRYRRQLRSCPHRFFLVIPFFVFKEALFFYTGIHIIRSGASKAPILGNKLIFFNNPGSSDLKFKSIIVLSKHGLKTSYTKTILLYFIVLFLEPANRQILKSFLTQFYVKKDKTSDWWRGLRRFLNSCIWFLIFVIKDQCVQHGKHSQKREESVIANKTTCVTGLAIHERSLTAHISWHLRNSLN